MRKPNDNDLPGRVNGLLAQSGTMADAARRLGYKNENILRQKLIRLGYKLDVTRRVVPIHPPEVTAQ